MGNTYYVDPAASGSNDGSSWTNAWTTLQSAADTATAGDVVYCRGTETLGARIDFDTQTGSNAAGFIKFVGCNASGNVDGTRFKLNGNSGNYAGIYITPGHDLYWFENIEVYGCSGGSSGFGFQTSAWNAGYGCVYINCCARNNYIGFLLGSYSLAVRCVGYSNTTQGIYSQGQAHAILCCFRDNGSSNILSNNITMIGCISHGSSDDGVALNSTSFLMNCVIDGNEDNGIDEAAHTSVYCAKIIGCRITNHSGAGDIGINCGGENVITGWCYFEDNDGDNIQTSTGSLLHWNIPLEGGSSSSNLEDLANTNEGYVDKTNHDFSTNYVDSGDPDLRRTAITIPWS